MTEELAHRQWDAATLATRCKGHAEKVRLAQWLQMETTMTLAWIANRLQMGTKTYLAHLLYWQRHSEK